MRSNLEPLRYSTLAPSRFVVVTRMSSRGSGRSLPLLRDQTSRALGEALADLNRQPFYRRYLKWGCAAGRERRAGVAISSCPTPTASWRRATSSFIPSSPAVARRQPGRGSGRAGSRRCGPTGRRRAVMRRSARRTGDRPRARPAALRGQPRHSHVRRCPGIRSRRARRGSYRADVNRLVGGRLTRARASGAIRRRALLPHRSQRSGPA
jgi:hypothetical protein